MSRNSFSVNRGSSNPDKAKNYIINGDMRISQRGTSFPAVANGQYTLDRWVYNKSGLMSHTVLQDTDVPTFAQSGYFFQNSLRLNLTTPDDSVDNNDFALLRQTIEGYNFARIAQKPFTLSFWVKSTTTGIRCISLSNLGDDRSMIKEYTINAANTWEKKIITFPASPAAGNWNYTNGVGLRVTWTIMSGSTYRVSNTTDWQTGIFLSTPNQVNGTATGNTDFRITGTMLNEGISAAPFSLFAEDFEGEVAACQRYYEKSYDLGVAPGAIDGNGSMSYSKHTTSSCQTMFNPRFKVEKRATPSVSSYDPVNGALNSYRDGNGNPVAANFNKIGTGGFFIVSTANTAQVGLNNENGVHWVANAEL